VRNLLIFLLVLVGIYWLRRQFKPPADRGGQGPADPGARPGASAERMVECAHCGLHIPESEALIGGGEPYCCEAHRREGPAGQ
jgi:uncharacterized protein